MISVFAISAFFYGYSLFLIVRVAPDDFSLAILEEDRIFGFLVYRAVAQLGSALEWGSRGRGFESRRPERRAAKIEALPLSKDRLYGLCGPELVEFSAKNGRPLDYAATLELDEEPAQVQGFKELALSVLRRAG
jgi:hypothetical protein